jgi:PPOX class probable FMN-dependent enzyme
MAITDEAELRALYGEMHPRAAKKVIDRLDGHCRAFISASPFVLIATTDGTRLDVSPKGDPAGSVVVEDDRHVLIADRPGNNRIDGLLNILRHPRVGTIFLIPGVRETLRVNGRGTIHAEPELLERCRMKGGLPITVLRIEVEEVFLHCAKALLRSRLWEPASWPAERPVPVMSDMIRDHIGEDLAHEPDEAMVKRYATMLY